MERMRDKGSHDRLQRDIDALLEDAEHVFDYMAEYAHDTDPEHVIDIDAILSEHARQQKHVLDRKLAEKRAAHVKKHAATHVRIFPKEPQRVIVAPPRELHEEVREYSELLKKGRETEGSRFGSLKFLFRRFEY